MYKAHYTLYLCFHVHRIHMIIQQPILTVFYMAFCTRNSSQWLKETCVPYIQCHRVRGKATPKLWQLAFELAQSFLSIIAMYSSYYSLGCCCVLSAAFCSCRFSSLLGRRRGTPKGSVALPFPYTHTLILCGCAMWVLLF